MKMTSVFGVVFLTSMTALAQQGFINLNNQKALPKDLSQKGKNLGESLFSEIKPLIKSVPSTYSVKKYSQGGQDGNGGDTALDPKTGSKKLLDLIEKDELEYFVPESVLVKDRIRFGSKTADILSRMFRFSLDNRDCTTSPRFNDSQTMYGSHQFVMAMTMSYAYFTLSDNYDDCLGEKYENLLNGIYSALKMKPVTLLKWAFTDHALEEINDEGFVKITNPETKKQLAIQKNGLVVISRAEFNLLDQESKEVFFLHETALRAVLLINPQHVEKYGTTYIRSYVRALNKFYRNRRSTPSHVVSDAYAFLEKN